SAPPSAERVARRAMVLSLIMYRASLENFPGEPHYEALQRRLSTWVDELGLDSELENEERAFLRRRLGRADEKAVCNAAWRNEGVGALAWALGRFELPPYDEGADPRAAGSSVGFSEELLAALDTAPAHDLLSHAELRPAAEI